VAEQQGRIAAKNMNGNPTPYRVSPDWKRVSFHCYYRLGICLRASGRSILLDERVRQSCSCGWLWFRVRLPVMRFMFMQSSLSVRELWRVGIGMLSQVRWHHC
jgi:hypothetical protein